MSASMMMPTLRSLVTVVKGWLFAGQHTLAVVLVAIGGSGSKLHSAYRLFAAALDPGHVGLGDLPPDCAPAGAGLRAAHPR